jgi:ATP-dependent DNA helicase DinG
MARLVARALRLGRSALIQTGSTSAYRGQHRLSYLMPALIWPEPVVLVLPRCYHQPLIQGDLPHLLQSLPTVKPVQVGECWPSPDFRGLLVTSPEAWLSGHLRGDFPEQIPTLIDGADFLENWVRDQLTCSLGESEWASLGLAYPGQQAQIRDIRVRLTHRVFQHPHNPYDCYLLDEPEQALLMELYECLAETPLHEVALPTTWHAFWRQLQHPDRLAWVQLKREQGSFTMHCAPVDIAAIMAPIWARQPLVLLGAALDLDPQAPVYRQQLGLGDLTCLKFTPDRQQDIIQLYLPDRLPMPNTRRFREAILHQIRILLELQRASSQPTVIIVGDDPLKAQIGSILAAEFGSRVQVEKLSLAENGILVTGWRFWHEHQPTLPAPGLLVVATLPIPSLEHPLVAGRVAYHKRLRQDWFRLYLLPEALRSLQLAIAPVRARQGRVALLDNRVNHRSYGQQVLTALSPAARSNYIDLDWLTLDQL